LLEPLNITSVQIGYKRQTDNYLGDIFDRFTNICAGSKNLHSRW